MKENLYIIIPAYNEEKNIKKVIHDYAGIVNRIKNNSKLIIVDDGSKDHTYDVALKESEKYKNVEILHKENGGHGSALIYGYKYAISKKASYIFQTDSDNQTNPEEFWEFWEQRKENDVIIGHRSKRKDGISRIIVTKVLKYLLFLIFHVLVKDANTPFRLMKREILEKYINRFSDDYNLPNVMLSVYFIHYKEKIKFIPIEFENRKQGVNSINIKKIFKIGFQSIKDFYSFRKQMLPKTDKYIIILVCLLLSILGMTLVSTSSPIYVTNMAVDSNAYFTLGRTILSGSVPYRDVFDQKGPILYFIYALGAFISSHSFIGIYIIEIIFFTIYLYYSAKTIKLFLPSKYIYLILPILTTLILTSKVFTFGGIPEELIYPMISFSLYNMLKSLKENKRLTSKELYINGFLCGLIFMMKFTLVGFYFTFMIFVLLKDLLQKKYKDIFKDAFIFLLAMITPFIIVSIYFLMNHSFKYFIQGYFEFNLFHYGMNINLSKKSIILYHLKNNIKMSYIGAFLMYLGIIHFTFNNRIYKKENKLLILLLFLGMFLFIFINGKWFVYYYLPLYIFALLGLIAVFDIARNYYKCKHYGLMLVLICIFSFFSLIHNPNITYFLNGKSSHPIFVFAKQMKGENKNPTVMNYETLDTGIHNVLEIIPNKKYYYKPNISDIQFDEIKESQNKILINKEVDYVIYRYIKKTKNKELIKQNVNKIEENYELINSQNFSLENKIFVYELYRRK